MRKPRLVPIGAHSGTALPPEGLHEAEGQAGQDRVRLCRLRRIHQQASLGHRGGHRARGSGSFHEKVCKPDCASGHYREFHADIRLRKPRVSECGGRRVRLFHTALLRFPGKEPPDAERFRKTRLFGTS
jgi:hypothetical protein